MKTSKFFVSVVFLSFINAHVSADVRSARNDLFSSLSTPHKLFSLKKNELAWQSKYSNTECLHFSTQRNKKKEIGFVCKSSNQDFQKDVGVILKKRDENNLEIELTTPSVLSASSEYPMEIFFDGTKTPIFSAIVDCEDTPAPIYRPTSSCHIAFKALENNFYIYSNFIIRNDQKKLNYISISDVKKLWREIDLVK